MPSSGNLITLAAAVTTANAAFQGFNYGAAFTNGAVKQQSDFEQEFDTAQNLDGTDGAFNSARLYTMIQGGTPNDPISAIPAAINTGTSLLFGLWASAGDEAFNGEIEALQKTIDQYCDQLDGLVAGISVGSEDLYRISPTGIANDEFAGANPDTLVGYIERVRDTIQGTCLSDAPIGHVDTWTAFDNSSNSAVIEACDWLGMDAYAYFEDTKPNSIENGAPLFQDALGRVEAAAGGKDIWITETGWPVSGKDFGQAVASPENARTFYEEVGCPRFGSVNVWWYTLKDAAPDTPNPSFGVIGSEFTTEPIFDLSCDASDGPSTSSSSSATEPAETSLEGAMPSPTSGEPEEEPSTTTIVEPEPESSTSVEASAIPVPSPDPETTAESEPETSLEGAMPSPTSGEPEEEPSTTTIVEPEPESSTSVEASAIPVPSPDPETTAEPQPEPESPSTTVVIVTPPTPSGNSPSEIPESGTTKLNSFGAGFVAIVLAMCLL